MPKKGKKAKKSADKAALTELRRQQEAAAAEEQRLYEEAIKAREQRLAASEAALQKREDATSARETELSQKFEALDAEVVLRARSGVAAAEAREAATQKLGATREERVMQRLASFADAETALAVREMRVAARERALEAKLNNTVAGHMDKMVAAQGDKREKLDALRRDVAVAEDVLQRQKDALTDRVTTARAVLAKKNSEAKKRVAVAERKLLEKEFARKRRMARSVTETAAFLEAQREKVVAREGQVASREEAIARRGAAVEQLVREARAYDIDVPKNEAAASPVPDRNVPVAELTGVIERVRKMAGAPDGATGADPSEEAGAVAAAAKEVQAAARLASRPYAARRLPDRRVDDALDAVEDDSARKEADEQQQKSLVARARWKRSIRKVGWAASLHTMARRRAAGFSDQLHARLHRADRPGVAEALDFSAIIADKRQQHLKGTREWVFDTVEKWRVDPDAAQLFWLVGGGGTGKSVAAAELLARLLDKENAAAWHFCKHTEPARSAPAVLLRSLAGMLCATVAGFEDALTETADVKTDKVDELFEALIAKPLQSVEAPRGADNALVLIIDALDELPRDALKPVLSLLSTELKELPPWIKIVATSRDEAQIKAALSGYTPTELRVDEGRNRQDVRAYLTVLAKQHVELEVTMESLRREVEAKFPDLKNLDGFAALEDPLRLSKSAYDEAVRGVEGIDALAAYKEQRDSELRQDEQNFEKLYADAEQAQELLVEKLQSLHDDVLSCGVKERESAARKLKDKYTDGDGVAHPEKFRDLARATVLFDTADGLLDVLKRLDGAGLEVAQRDAVF